MGVRAISFKGPVVSDKKWKKAVHPETERKMANGTLLHDIEQDEIARRGGHTLPPFRVGDFLEVHVRESIKGADCNDVTKIRGLCLAIRNRGVRSAFIIRGDWHGVIYEQQLPMYGPWIAHLEVLESYPVRRSKLYFMRERDGLIPIAQREARKRKLKVF